MAGANSTKGRFALAFERDPERSERPPFRRLIGEAQILFEPVRRLSRKIEVEPAEKPKLVMLLPGFVTHPIRMRYMAQHLERAGHTVKRWGTGANMGATPERLAIVEQRLDDISQRYGQPAALVGWSLGGLYARELAKRHPEQVSKVVTMGSPFSGKPRANHAWRAYQFVTGQSVDDPPIKTNPAEKPPVETVALWSPIDGIIPPICAAGQPEERDRAVEVRCTHIGFGYSTASITAVLRELDGA